MFGASSKLASVMEFGLNGKDGGNGEDEENSVPLMLKSRLRHWPGDVSVEVWFHRQCRSDADVN